MTTWNKFRLTLCAGSLAMLWSACQHEPSEPVLPPPPPVNTIVWTDYNRSITVAGSSDTLQPDSANPAALVFEITAQNAIRVKPLNCQLLDNSTHGYPDALRLADTVSAAGNWSTQTGVLASSAHSGRFEGAGYRYLGFRIPLAGGQYRYGWVRLYCPAGNNRLDILDYAVNTAPDALLYAGQKDSNVIPPAEQPVVVNGPGDIAGNYRSTPDSAGSYCSISIKESADPAYDFYVQGFPFMWPYPLLGGKISGSHLTVPYVAYDGNIPSPGGTPRLYQATFAGSGHLFIDAQGKKRIEWNISYNKTGFLAESFYGLFVMYKCE